MTTQDANFAWAKGRYHVLHPYTDFITFKDEGSEVIETAKGPYVTDGRRLLDGIANLYAKPGTMTEEAYCEGLVQEFENRIEQHGAENVAACIAEPIMGEGRVLVGPKGYHRRIWEVCKRHDMLYIADEVVTAFGRLGEWFGSESVFDYQPDILVSAKGITSGYIPLGSTLISDEIYEVISRPQ